MSHGIGSYRRFQVSTLILLAETNGTPEYRSIAEVVGGLHGGKYQFGDNNSSSSSSMPSDEFGGHGTSSSNKKKESILAKIVDDQLPKWAQNMRPKTIDKEHPETLPLPNTRTTTFVHIRNDERTWEPFYAMVWREEKDRSFGQFDPKEIGLKLTPSCGTLAPRGGANNACNPNQPYADNVRIEVSRSKNWIPEDPLWLVVGTEEEQWSYKLEFLDEN